MAKVKFKIDKQCFFNNGELLLPFLKDKSGKSLERSIKDWLCQDYILSTKEHKSPKTGNTWTGYTATNLNRELRMKMSCIKGIHGETHVEYHSLLHVTKKGFDFSLYDEDYNYVQLRNACVGNPGIYNGDTILAGMYKKLRKKNSDKKPMTKAEWSKILTDIGGNPGENVNAHKNSLTVVGELQFGNWALANHDLLRLLNSSTENPIDYYIYITATDTLASSLSQGIVTYEKIVDCIQENIHILPVPMWIIALDISK